MARAAATLVFLLTGTSTATWAARVPAIQHDLELSAGALALAVLGLEGGAILGLPAGGALATRLGSRAALRIGFALYPVALLAVGLAGSLAGLAAALAGMAFATSINDVAMNAQGVELERRARRPLLSGLHAGHSFGVLAGGLGGTAAAAAGVGVGAHFALVAALGLVLGQLAAAALVREPVDGAAVWLAAGAAGDDAAGARRGRPPAIALPDRPLALLGAIAFCAFLLDGAAYAWIAVHLSAERDAGPALAAAGFTAFALALALARLAGDRLVARYGRAAVVRAGAGVVAGGCVLALAAQSPPLALAGWAVVGAGVAPIAPAVLGAAPAVSSLPPAVAIAAVTTVGYLGSFTGPPAIGALAGPLGLTAALAVLIAVSATAALTASALDARPASARSGGRRRARPPVPAARTPPPSAGR
jgi:MFS family permease